jgi:phospholipase/carboxylesterase
MIETISAVSNAGESVTRAVPETVEVTTGAVPVNAVIWLHGLGADGHDFEPVVPILGLDRIGATRFVFPHAPVRPVTINGGMQMRAWYDIRGIDISRDQDEEGIADSAALVRALVQREIERGIPASRIVLAGFSQGGAIAAHVALRYPHKLAGLMVLSTYLLFPDRLEADISQAGREIDVFAGHGSMDPMVPVSLGKNLTASLKALNLQVSWHEYPMPHSVIQQELDDIGAWLRTRLED